MIDEGALREVISLYNKHGWLLRRALLTESSRSNMGHSAQALLREARIRMSELDALWFSRPRQGQVAWELRSLDEPFALVRVVDEEIDGDELETALRETERQMVERRTGQISH